MKTGEYSPERFRELMKRRLVTIEMLIDRSGVSRSTVYRFFRTGEIGVGSMRRLARSGLSLKDEELAALREDG